MGDNSDLKNKLLAASRVRVRSGMVTIGDERFQLEFRVYPAAELTALIAKMKKAGTKGTAEILSAQILDPADKRPMFTAAEIEELPNCDMNELAEAFFRVNFGDGTKKN